jgi:hypothetical protein
VARQRIAARAASFLPLARRMTKVADTSAMVGAQTIVGVFDREADARKAVQSLERAGMPPDRIGFVTGNVRQAREVAGSYSPQGALAGAMIGALLAAAYVVFGGEQIRQNPVAIALGAFAIIGGLTFIGWLAGRARVFKKEEYEHFEDEAAEGEILVSVVCETEDGATATQGIFRRAAAREVRVEDSAEAV